MAHEHTVDPSGKVGGKKVTDDLFRTLITSVLLKGVDFGLNTRFVTDLLASIPPNYLKWSDSLEYFATVVVAKMPLSWFPSPTVAHWMQDLLIEVSRHLQKKIDKLKHGEHLKPEEVKGALEDALEATMGKGFLIDPLGLGHGDDCIRCRQAFKENELLSVTYQQMLAQNVMIAPCCFVRAREAAREAIGAGFIDTDGTEVSEGPDAATKPAAGAKPKARKPPSTEHLRSAAAVFRKAREEGYGAEADLVIDWMERLPEPRKTEVKTFVMDHLDTVSELVELGETLRDQPQRIDFVLAMIQNSNGLHKAHGVLQYILQCAKCAQSGIVAGAKGFANGAKAVWTFGVRKNDELNTALEPALGRLIAGVDGDGNKANAFRSLLGSRGKPEKLGFWAGLRRLI